MNASVVLLAVGLAVGGLVGWVTAPEVSTVQVGPLNLQVTGEGGEVSATNKDGQVSVSVGDQGPLADRNSRTAIFAVVGALVGFGAGFVADRRRKT